MQDKKKKSAVDLLAALVKTASETKTEDAPIEDTSDSSKDLIKRLKAAKTVRKKVVTTQPCCYCGDPNCGCGPFTFTTEFEDGYMTCIKDDNGNVVRRLR